MNPSSGCVLCDISMYLCHYHNLATVFRWPAHVSSACCSPYSCEKMLLNTTDNALRKVCNIRFSSKSSISIKRMLLFFSFIVRRKEIFFVNLPTKFGKSVVFQVLHYYIKYKVTSDKNFVHHNTVSFSKSTF